MAVDTFLVYVGVYSSRDNALDDYEAVHVLLPRRVRLEVMHPGKLHPARHHRIALNGIDHPRSSLGGEDAQHARAGTALEHALVLGHEADGAP